jgi:hypothetical protein
MWLFRLRIGAIRHHLTDRRVDVAAELSADSWRRKRPRG